MYEYLEGRIASRSASRLVIDVSGVGYDLAVPLGVTFGPLRAAHDGGEAPPSTGAFRTGEELRTSPLVRIFTHLNVREDCQELFGFPDRASRELFRMLLRVRGVGPTMALGVLSGFARLELLEAIAEERIADLVRIKGVGRKTAQQILLDLGELAKKQLALENSGAVAGGVLHPPPSAGRENLEDAISALVSIGFPEKEARKNVERAALEVDHKDVELLVRTALQRT